MAGDVVNIKVCRPLKLRSDLTSNCHVICHFSYNLTLMKNKISQMNEEYQCPECKSENTYKDGNIWICPDCFHEWNPANQAISENQESDALVVLDSNGNALNDGDSITVIKDLKVKGAGSGIKAGTKAKNIRLIESTDGHNISCKIDGIGAMYLKSEFVKKA